MPAREALRATCWALAILNNAVAPSAVFAREWARFSPDNIKMALIVAAVPAGADPRC
jgi:hypothetical protein